MRKNKIIENVKNGIKDAIKNDNNYFRKTREDNLFDYFSSIMDSNPAAKCLILIAIFSFITIYGLSLLYFNCGSLFFDNLSKGIDLYKWWNIGVLFVTFLYALGIVRPKKSIFSHKFNFIRGFILLLGMFIYPLTPDFRGRFGIINSFNSGNYYALILPLWIMLYTIAIVPNSKTSILDKQEIKQLKKDLVDRKVYKKFLIHDEKSFLSRFLIDFNIITLLFTILIYWICSINQVSEGYENNFLALPFSLLLIGIGIFGLLRNGANFIKSKYKVSIKDFLFPIMKNAKIKDGVILDKPTEKKVKEKKVEEKNIALTIDSVKLDEEAKKIEINKNDKNKMNIKLKSFKTDRHNALFLIFVGTFFFCLLAFASVDFDFNKILNDWYIIIFPFVAGTIAILINLYKEHLFKRIYEQVQNGTIVIKIGKLIKFKRYRNLISGKYIRSLYGYYMVFSDGNREYKSKKYSDEDLGIDYQYSDFVDILNSDFRETSINKIYDNGKIYNLGDKVRIFIDNKHSSNYYVDI